MNYGLRINNKSIECQGVVETSHCGVSTLNTSPTLTITNHADLAGNHHSPITNHHSLFTIHYSQN